MIRCIKSEYVSFENESGTAWLRYIEAAGLSTDQKPSVNIVTGSKFLEVDTGKQYAYDEIGGEWYEMAGSSSGGSFNPDITSPQDGDTLVYNAAQSKWVNGAASGGGVLVVNLVMNQDGNNTLDKTWQEIFDADYAIIRYKDATSEYYNLVMNCNVYDGVYYVISLSDSVLHEEVYVASSASGYPVLQL